MDNLIKELIDINLYLKEYNITPSSKVLNEGATYYDLRSLLSVLIKTSHDDTLKHMLKELMKTIAKLEVKNVTTPTIARLKSVSPELFPS